MSDIQVRQIHTTVVDSLRQAGTYLEALRARINDDLVGESHRAEHALAVTRWCDVADAARLLQQAQEVLAKHLPPIAGSVAADPFVDVALLDGEVTQLLTGGPVPPAGVRVPASHRPVPAVVRAEPGLDTGSFLAGVRGKLRRNRGLGWRR